MSARFGGRGIGGWRYLSVIYLTIDRHCYIITSVRIMLQVFLAATSAFAFLKPPDTPC